MKGCQWKVSLPGPNEIFPSLHPCILSSQRWTSYTGNRDPSGKRLQHIQESRTDRLKEGKPGNPIQKLFNSATKNRSQSLVEAQQFTRKLSVWKKKERTSERERKTVPQSYSEDKFGKYTWKFSLNRKIIKHPKGEGDCLSNDNGYSRGNDLNR